MAPPPPKKSTRSNRQTPCLIFYPSSRNSARLLQKPNRLSTPSPSSLPKWSHQHKFLSGALVTLVNLAWVQVTSTSCPSLREIPGSRRRSLKVSLVPARVQALSGLPLVVYILFSLTKTALYVPLLCAFNQMLTNLRRFGPVV